MSNVTRMPHLSLKDRIAIQDGVQRGLSQRAICMETGRSPSAVCTELKRYSDADGFYDAYIAHDLYVWKVRRRGTPPRMSRFIDAKGYAYYKAIHPKNSRLKTTKILEHVLVMEKFLGRALYVGENVHHKNGVRDDNRIENLELWVSSQPSGQRPEDLVLWAKEILAKYDREVCGS